MHLKPVMVLLSVSLLALTPSVPLVGPSDGGAAFAKGEGGGGNGNGGGGGNGNGNGNGGKDKGNKGKGETASSKPSKGNSVSTKVKGNSSAVEVAKVKGKKPDDGTLHPSQLGKMNGALNANINAVLAHIRNGQTTNGPVGLLAGLAVADSAAASAIGAAGELEQLAADFEILGAALTAAGFASPEGYLQAKADGTLTPEQIAAIDPLIGAVGGTDDTGLALADSAPTPEEIQAALDAEAGALQGVTDAEQAIIDAWNKDGDAGALLSSLREKLAANQTAIDATIAEISADEEEAVAAPLEEIVIK